MKDRRYPVFCHEKHNDDKMFKKLVDSKQLVDGWRMPGYESLQCSYFAGKLSLRNADPTQSPSHLSLLP